MIDFNQACWKIHHRIDIKSEALKVPICISSDINYMLDQIKFAAI